MESNGWKDDFQTIQSENEKLKKHIEYWENGYE